MLKEILQMNPELVNLIKGDPEIAGVFLCFEPGESRKLIADLCYENFLYGSLIPTVFNIVCKEDPRRFISLLQGGWDTFTKAIQQEPKANQVFGQFGHPLASSTALGPYYKKVLAYCDKERRLLQKVPKKAFDLLKNLGTDFL